MKRFEANKNAMEQGIDITRDFVVVSDECCPSNVGDIFKHKSSDKWYILSLFERKSDGEQLYMYWSNLYYATETNNTTNKVKIKLLEEKKQAIQKEIDELEKETIDFSKFVARSGSSLVIKWDKYLASHNNWDIAYRSTYNTSNTPPDYTHTTVWELERGDVFICEDNVECMELCSFNVYIGEWIVQYLSNYYSVERIYSTRYDLQVKVIKFLRT